MNELATFLINMLLSILKGFQGKRWGDKGERWALKERVRLNLFAFLKFKNKIEKPT